MSSCSKIPPAKRPAPDRFDPLALFQTLRLRFGPSGWWPGDSPLEVAIGAVLTQNTAWVNVEKAIENLKAHAMVDIHRIHEADHSVLASLIRPSGYYNLKAKRLKNLIDAIMETSSGDIDAFLGRDKISLRDILLKVNGIGKETADSICCYAGDKTAFVVDAYTRRILLNHGIIDTCAVYDDIQELFEQDLPCDLTIYKDLHAYLVFVGKDHCRPREHRCSTCPLENWP
jgi:endonuclease III related protein